VKPNYDEMSNAELRNYILANRQDGEAVEAFFARRVLIRRQLGTLPPQRQKNGGNKWRCFIPFWKLTGKIQRGEIQRDATLNPKGYRYHLLNKRLINSSRLKLE
jgi:hypothetical protein